jgi:hypothetical protein
VHLGDAARGVDNARKLDEPAITGGLDDPTLMLADVRVDEFAAVRLTNMPT